MCGNPKRISTTEVTQTLSETTGLSCQTQWKPKAYQHHRSDPDTIRNQWNSLFDFATIHAYSCWQYLQKEDGRSHSIIKITTYIPQGFTWSFVDIPSAWASSRKLWHTSQNLPPGSAGLWRQVWRKCQQSMRCSVQSLHLLHQLLRVLRRTSSNLHTCPSQWQLGSILWSQPLPEEPAILLSTWRTCEASGVFNATLTSFFMGLATTVSPLSHIPGLVVNGRTIRRSSNCIIPFRIWAQLLWFILSTLTSVCHCTCHGSRRWVRQSLTTTLSLSTIHQTSFRCFLHETLQLS